MAFSGVMPLETMYRRDDRGIFVAFEGIDGAGKTTQVAMLRAALEAVGESPIVSKEPTGGEWGRKIRASATNGRMPLEDELHAFIQDRSEHIQGLVAPALRNGKIVILDRYFYSTIAYQGGRGGDVDELRHEMISRFPLPDVVFVLDIDPTLGLFRISHSRGETPNRFENVPELTKARHIFNNLASTHSEVRQFDGSVSQVAAHAEILREFVDGPLKAKRCAKEYGCSDPYHCGPAITGNCDWWDMSRRLLASLHQPYAPVGSA